MQVLLSVKTTYFKLSSQSWRCFFMLTVELFKRRVVVFCFVSLFSLFVLYCFCCFPFLKFLSPACFLQRIGNGRALCFCISVMCLYVFLFLYAIFDVCL